MNQNMFLFRAALFFFAASVQALSLILRTSLSGNASTTESSPAMITVPILSGQYLEYNIAITDNVGLEILVLLDYMQPHLWLVNAAEVLNCSAVYAIYLSYNFTEIPSYVTVSGETYNIDECYNNGAYTPVMITTVVNGSQTSTVTQAASVASTSSLNITYPYDYYGSGYFMESNFSLGTEDSNLLELEELLFLMVDDTNVAQGGFGLSGPVQAGGVLDSLKTQGLIFGSGFSTYFFNQSVSDEVGGYLLLGSVDQHLYLGDFYLFPQIPHEGWCDENRILPILQLDSIELENIETEEYATLYGESIAVVLDPTLVFSYLPRSVIISLALQANAYYISDYDTWIVNCSTVNDIDAAVNFGFGPLNVQVPLRSIVQPSLYTNLTFDDGQEACIFNISPSDFLGYNALGVSFLLNIYMAMDNEGGRIAVANANTDLTLRAVNSTTVGYIRLDTIPFATNATVSSDLTLTFGTMNNSGAYLDPGLLTNVIVSAGHVYFSLKATARSSASDSASAADAKSTSGGAGSLNQHVTSGNSVLYLVLLLGGVMGLVFV